MLAQILTEILNDTVTFDSWIYASHLVFLSIASRLQSKGVIYEANLLFSDRRKNLHKRMGLFNRCSNSRLHHHTHSRCPQTVFPSLPFTSNSSSFGIYLCAYALYIVNRRIKNWSSNSLRCYVSLQTELSNPFLIAVHNAFIYPHIHYELISQQELRNIVLWGKTHN